MIIQKYTRTVNKKRVPQYYDGSHNPSGKPSACTLFAMAMLSVSGLKKLESRTFLGLPLPGPGVIRFQLDNSFSRFRKKEVKVEVHAVEQSAVVESRYVELDQSKILILGSFEDGLS